MQDGLPSNVINGILTDDNNCIWLSTNNGLSKMTLIEGEDSLTASITNFNESEFVRALKSELREQLGKVMDMTNVDFKRGWITFN